MGKFVDLTGRCFGFYTVLRRAPQAVKGATRWECRCDCGKISIVQAPRLLTGRSGSCGCRKGERVSAKITKHGHYVGNKASPEYRTWRAMLTRCENRNCNRYADYGGRGITVCDRWHEFTAFLADMGPRPSGATIERIDNTKGYSPENCRWATPKEQSQNLRNTRHVRVGQRIMTIRQASEEFGIPYEQLRNALYGRGEHSVNGVRVSLLQRQRPSRI